MNLYSMRESRYGEWLAVGMKEKWAMNIYVDINVYVDRDSILRALN